jgi:general secretion pathway protein J
MKKPFPRHDEGFTLIELLIAMTLLGFLTILLFGGLRFGARAWERTEAHESGMDEVRLVQGLLQREIEQAYPYFVASESGDGQVDFRGTADSMTLLAPAPEAFGGAGRAHISFRVSRSGNSIRLVMLERPELANSDDAVRQETLLTNLASVRFSYFGNSGTGGPVWHDRWSGQATVPQLVRVHVEFPKGDARVWPELIAAPRIFADANCVYDAGTKKCQGRK